MREQAPMSTTRYCLRQCTSSPLTCEMTFMQLYAQRYAFASMTCTRRDSEYTYRCKVTNWTLCNTTPASASGSPPRVNSCWKQRDKGKKWERACVAIYAEHVARSPGRGQRPSGVAPHLPTAGNMMTCRVVHMWCRACVVRRAVDPCATAIDHGIIMATHMITVAIMKYGLRVLSARFWRQSLPIPPAASTSTASEKALAERDGSSLALADPRPPPLLAGGSSNALES